MLNALRGTSQRLLISVCWLVEQYAGDTEGKITSVLDESILELPTNLRMCSGCRDFKCHTKVTCHIVLAAQRSVCLSSLAARRFFLRKLGEADSKPCSRVVGCALICLR